MRLLSKLIVGTTCVTIFAGTAYIVMITLAPPPNYTVSNTDRLKSYDRLAVGNVYEKKTKSQEFYLGLSRWRRKMLKEEGMLHGRVLEIGAGCGGNLAYYPSDYFSDDEEIHKYMGEVMQLKNDGASAPDGKASKDAGSATSYISLVLGHIKKMNQCDEIVLCDRSANMVESCSLKVQNRLGYTPYRYPDYDLEGIREHIKGRQKSSKGEPAVSGGTRKRKLVYEDGTVQEVLSTPIDGNDESQFMDAEESTLAPILHEVAPGDKLPLLSKDGEKKVRLRQMYISARQQFRLSFERALEYKESDLIERRESRMDSAGLTADRGAVDNRKQPRNKPGGKPAEVPAIPPVMEAGSGGKVAPQPLFSVCNYAAEQLPFADNSFDSVVDMFGLCSYDDPVRALREMSRVCKPGGKLLLVEHGRGSTPRVNNHLDKWAPRHAKNWGCWWNRDIRRVIRLSGLTVEKWDNKHFGTSHYIIAKPYKTMDEWDRHKASQANA